MTGIRIRARLALPLLFMLTAQSASAHIPQRRGRLVDLVSRSSLIVIGIVDSVRPLDAHVTSTTVRVAETLLGDTHDTVLTFNARPSFAPGARYVFFLGRDDDGLECLQATGAVFPTSPADDEAYRDVVSGIQQALRPSDDEGVAALRAAIIPALSAPVPQLRYQAVLELGELAHHGLSASERQALERLRADPPTDSSLRPIVAALISSAPPAEAAPAAADSGADADAESRWSWLPDDLSASGLQRYMQRLGNRPFAPLWIAAVYVAAGMIAVPLTVLIIATLVTYGALHGIPYALFGAVASAAVTFGVGRAMGELTVKRLFGTRFESVRDRLARCNVMEMTFVRMLPVAPFSLVNIIAGGAGIPFTSFLGGTVLGVAPGIAAFALVTSGLTGTGGAAVVSAVAGVLVLALLAAARRWARTENSLAARLQQWQRERSPR